MFLLYLLLAIALLYGGIYFMLSRSIQQNFVG